MNALLLLLTLTTSTLVLRSGDRITVEGDVRETNGVVTFRANGLLYSMPASEVDVDATKNAGTNAEWRRRAADADAKPAPQPKVKLKVSEAERKRLLEQLENNHSGSPAPPSQSVVDGPHIKVTEPTPPPGDEWSWRHQAQAHEEAIRRAKEEVAMLESRAQQLESEIRGFFALGYKASQFTYQSTQLQQAREQLPYAQLEVTRAERAYEQFREEARRQGVLPGWLR
ncbi:MAG: hypothetical protein JO197_19670 [Acidobacteria bacterium]|nr:hypothetical protein [Acidobacteriota bacterium]MBV9478578.1 hypothetical protein [Acidobacteriota bacterium]